MVSFSQASLTARMLSGEDGKKEYFLMEEYPFWTPEEVTAAKVERLKQQMLQMVHGHNAALKAKQEKVEE